MNTTELKKFAQLARRQLIEQVGARLNLVLQDDSAVLRGQEKALQQLQDEIANKFQRSCDLIGASMLIVGWGAVKLIV